MLSLAKKIGESISNQPTKKKINPTISSDVFLQIKPFKENEKGINHRDTLMKNIIPLKAKNISFIIQWNKTDIKLFCKLPKDFRTFFNNTFFANFDTSDIDEATNDEIKLLCEKAGNTKYINYEKDSKIHDKEFFKKDGTYMDPMNNLFPLFINIAEKDSLSISFTYTFKKETTLKDHIVKTAKRIRWTNEKKKDDDNKKEEKKPGDCFLSISYCIKSNDTYSIENTEKNIKNALSVFWWKSKIKNKPSNIELTFDQAVNFFHIPTKANYIKGMQYIFYRKLPYPNNINTPENCVKKEITVLGKTNYRWEDIPFWIKKEDKFRHMYIIGKTGTGKSTLISNMVKSDMEAWNGLCLLDPHGDLVDTVMEHIPTNRINDVILFDVSDTEYPIGFNLLQADNDDEKNRIASWVVATFNKLFEHSWGPRLEYILRNVVLSIIEYPNATLMHILRILTDKEFREEVVSHISDSVVKKFRTNEFGKRNDKQREEAVGPITNKIGQFLSSKIVRNIFSQPRTKLNIRKAMDEGKIILVNLSKGKIWEDNASMIGSLLVTKIQIDAMSRADIPMNERRDFYLYIDEFQNFATRSFATILSEARKYRLSLIVANQFTSQLDEEIKSAIFGNVGSVMAFTLGKDDAEVISGQFKWITTPNDLISLPMFTAYIKLMTNGISGDPFSMKTMPLSTPEWSVELIEKLRKQSRARYATERTKLEELLDAWNKKTFSLQEKIAEKAELESLWIEPDEIENIKNNIVEWELVTFQETKIDEEEADAIIFNIKNKKHKLVWYKEPDEFIRHISSKIPKGKIIKNFETKEISLKTDIYINKDNKYQIRVWQKNEIKTQLKEIYGENDAFLFVPNIDKLNKISKANQKDEKTDIIEPIIDNTKRIWRPFVKKGSTTTTPSPEKSTNNNPMTKFSVNDIKIGERYEGYIKLQYNYGMFITVKWVEGLLHKNFIEAPEWVSRKSFYNIWDRIKIKAKEFKEIDGEKRVVWTQI